MRAKANTEILTLRFRMTSGVEGIRGEVYVPSIAKVLRSMGHPSVFGMSVRAVYVPPKRSLDGAPWRLGLRLPSRI